MSGPRVTTGDESMQDGATPADFMAAVEKRFGQVQFDLAAHRLNKKHTRYFAPTEFVFKFDPAKHLSPDPIVKMLVGRGAREDQARKAMEYAFARSKKAPVSVANHDPDAFNFDAFAHCWSDLSAKFAAPNGGLGLLWLNCEWSDIRPWATKCRDEGKDGANVVLLTHVAITDWFCQLIAGSADVHLLSGRQCFDGKNVLPKDTMLSHFWPGATGRIAIWDWRQDRMIASWCLADSEAEARAL